MPGIRDENIHLYHGFYKGKVVDNEDEENRGRCRIRILGLHSQLTVEDNKDGIPDDHLPWAEQAAPIFGGFGPAKAGISMSPEIGSWVWLFFDNGNHNKPVYFASIPGNNDRQQKELADIDDYTGSITDTITKIKTKSGHIIEIIDIENKEQINIEHTNGAAISMDTFDNNPRIIISATGNGNVTIDADSVNIAGGIGYPLMSTKPDTLYTVGGHTFYSAAKTSVS